MTNTKLAAGVAGALWLTFAGTVAYAAQGEGGYACQTANPAKAAPVVTHCVTWTHQAAARLAATGCDPARMASAAMRAACAQLTAHPERTAAG